MLVIPSSLSRCFGCSSLLGGGRSRSRSWTKLLRLKPSTDGLSERSCWYWRHIMADRNSFRLAAALLFIGQLANLAFILLHPHGAANDQATFTAFAASSSWVAVHLGQFVAA